MNRHFHNLARWYGRTYEGLDITNPINVSQLMQEVTAAVGRIDLNTYWEHLRRETEGWEVCCVLWISTPATLFLSSTTSEGCGQAAHPTATCLIIQDIPTVIMQSCTNTVANRHHASTDECTDFGHLYPILDTVLTMLLVPAAARLSTARHSITQHSNVKQMIAHQSTS